MAGAQGPAAPDGDFGATPTLFTASIDGKPTKLVGAVNKNGIYYAFRRGDVAAGPVWKTTPLSIYPVTIASSAWDGQPTSTRRHADEDRGALVHAPAFAQSIHRPANSSGRGAHRAVTPKRR